MPDSRHPINYNRQPLIFAGHHFIADPSGALIWPEKKLLIVADMHLEKGSWFAQSGQFLPPYDSLTILKKLKQVIEVYGCLKILLLGDSFHDKDGYYRLSINEKEIFNNLLDNYGCLWVEGNHDNGFVPEGLMNYEEFTIDNVTFRHQAASNFSDFEISGHFHPKVSLLTRGKKFALPCFLQTQQRLLLPAFGAYAGGLNIDSSAISECFSKPEVIFAVGKNRVYKL